MKKSIRYINAYSPKKTKVVAKKKNYKSNSISISKVQNYIKLIIDFLPYFKLMKCIINEILE